MPAPENRGRWILRHVAAKPLRMLKHRNFLVLLNTAVAAGSSMVLLLGAARSLDPQQLSSFSLVQLIVMTAVMLQRAFILSPALASQRNHGKGQIPALWGVKLALPSAVLLGILLAALMGAAEGSILRWLPICVATCSVVLVQDCLRFNLLSRNLTHGAVLSDSVWLFLLAVTLAFQHLFTSAQSLALYWGGTGIIAVAIGLYFVRKRNDLQIALRSSSLKQAWQLGKWSGLDAMMSATANLAPMLMTAFVIGSEHAGTYRVLQSSLGPLNILSTSLLTMMGLDAWKLVSSAALLNLRSMVRKSMLAMTIFATGYIAIAELLIVAVSGLESSDLLRIALIVGIVGVFGAATAPLSAASLALGYQKHGAALRLVIVIFSLTTSVLSGMGLWLPWSDPIGTVTLFAAATGLIGWTVSFGRAMKLETNQIMPTAASPAAGRHFSSHPH